MRHILTLKNIADEERGFTLIEILVALVIAAVLAIGVLVALAQINKVDYICNSKVIAVKQVENAIHYINRDIQQAQKIEVDGTDYWIRLTWVSWDDGSTTQIIYKVDNNQNLTRQESVTLGGSTSTTTTNVARYIDSGSKSITEPDTGLTPPEKSWTVQLTSSYTSGSKTATETREIKVIPRPGS
jgi:prepilin-type N-terminal cleavage/methylation domain-containing protein